MLTKEQINKLKYLTQYQIDDHDDKYIEINVEFVDLNINKLELQNKTREYFIKQYNKHINYYNFDSIYHFYKYLDDELREYIYQRIITQNLYDKLRDDVYKNIMDILEISYEELDEMLYNNLEIYISLNQIYDICFATPIYGTIALANEDDFNKEFSEDSDNFFNYEDKEEYDNQTNHFLTKNNLKASDIDLDNPPELILGLHDSLIQAGKNNTLCYPTTLKIKDLIEIFNNNSSLIISSDITTLGYHDYIYGAGSIPISKNLIELNQDISYQPKQWMFISEQTYGYDLNQVYDYKPEDFYIYKNTFKINNKIKSFFNN